LKKNPDRSICIDDRAFHIEGEKIDPAMLDFTKQYVYAGEELDKKFPRPLGEELDTSIFFDSDHTHDKISGRSISSVIVMVGSTPIIWRSKRQGAVQTSTYGAEFSAMKLATEETIAIRYMLQALGIKISTPSAIAGNNAGVIANVSMPDATLKKKHVALSYHTVRENVAAGVIHPYKVSSKVNVADLLTKPLDRNTFMNHTKKVLKLNTGKNEPHNL
jgi:hypothetical protein